MPGLGRGLRVLGWVLRDGELLADAKGGGLGGGEDELQGSPGAVDADENGVVVGCQAEDGAGKVLAVGEYLFWRALVFYFAFFQFDNGVG